MYRLDERQIRGGVFMDSQVAEKNGGFFLLLKTWEIKFLIQFIYLSVYGYWHWLHRGSCPLLGFLSLILQMAKQSQL